VANGLSSLRHRHFCAAWWEASAPVAAGYAVCALLAGHLTWLCRYRAVRQDVAVDGVLAVAAAVHQKQHSANGVFSTRHARTLYSRVRLRPALATATA
jgi:hypothetical protein